MTMVTISAGLVSLALLGAVAAALARQLARDAAARARLQPVRVRVTERGARRSERL
ncbi:hypothetical protein [Paraburkholderia megapolitana]|uniref:Uncharacterized protein n=2 Tax=Burkholderiaceae TaxID=119060 RepID=A0A1I3QQJ5_9BURK|nr:hypothetical protein [Paraburkholderia megapolitana]MCX4163255.1 hypothetical protein [Paraburkholderia megapolitana]MDN7158751.1 hypothetical protein [Paraburkholderia sp. CHISQ3]MDQ6495798.1 hypothetical protein [Paraburkholderia megapolitana]SFJ35561.1 hypothetical protein SAMN05192543_106473 [Paraburkholderia megapolitana]